MSLCVFPAPVCTGAGLAVFVLPLRSAPQACWNRRRREFTEACVQQSGSLSCSSKAGAGGGEDERTPSTTCSSSPPTSSWHVHLSPSLPSFVASLHREIAQQDVVLNNRRHPVGQLRQSMRASRARQRRQRESKRANAVVAECVCVCKREKGREREGAREREGLPLLIRPCTHFASLAQELLMLPLFSSPC